MSPTGAERLTEGTIPELDATYDDVTNERYVAAMFKLLTSRAGSKLARWIEKNSDVISQINQADFNAELVSKVESYFTKILSPSEDHQLAVGWAGADRGHVGFFRFADWDSKVSVPTELDSTAEDWAEDWNSVTCPLD